MVDVAVHLLTPGSAAQADDNGNSSSGEAEPQLPPPIGRCAWPFTTPQLTMSEHAQCCQAHCTGANGVHHSVADGIVVLHPKRGVEPNQQSASMDMEGTAGEGLMASLTGASGMLICSQQYTNAVWNLRSTLCMRAAHCVMHSRHRHAGLMQSACRSPTLGRRLAGTTACDATAEGNVAAAASNNAAESNAGGATAARQDVADVEAAAGALLRGCEVLITTPCQVQVSPSCRHQKTFCRPRTHCRPMLARPGVGTAHGLLTYGQDVLTSLHSPCVLF